MPFRRKFAIGTKRRERNEAVERHVIVGEMLGFTLRVAGRD